MFTTQEIVNSTRESYQKDILHAEEVRRAGFESGNKWYVSVLSESIVQSNDICILEIVGCYATERDAVMAFCLRTGQKKRCLTRSALKSYIRQSHNKHIYNYIQFITIREMRYTDDYKCAFDRYDKLMNLDCLSEMPECIMVRYNDTYANEEDNKENKEPEAK